jgi:hypothetical protein
MMMLIPNSLRRKAPFRIERRRLNVGFQNGRMAIEDSGVFGPGPINVSFHYMYRDASNYKQHSTVVFTNHTFLSIKDIEKQIHSCLHEGEYFIASQINIEERFFATLGEDDHPWHEFVKVETTAEGASDPANQEKHSCNRDIVDFIQDLEKAKRDGWNKMNVRPDMAQLLESEMLDLRQAFEAGKDILK